MKSVNKILISVFILAFTGCSPVKFYSNAELTKQSGFKYYTPKPYLQVERDQVTDNIVKATILYLPDLALKVMPPTAASSTTMTEFYDIVMSNGITSVKKIELK